MPKKKLMVRKDAKWDESKHPRADDGQFGSGTGPAKSAESDKHFAERDKNLAAARTARLAGNKGKATLHAVRAKAADAQGKALLQREQAGSAEASDAKNPAKAPSGPSAAAKPVVDGQPLRPTAPRDLSTEDEKTVRDWTMTGLSDPGHYANIQAALNGEPKSHVDSTKSLEAAERLNRLVAASPLTAKKTVYRGTTNMSDFTVGQTLKTPRLQSSTSSKAMAERFAFNSVKPKHKGTVFHIEAEAGTPLFDMGRVLGKTDESEHLFGSNQEFTVKSVGRYNSDNIRVVKLTAKPLKIEKRAKATPEKNPAVCKDAKWDESKHPRADDGQFGSGTGSSGPAKPEAHPTSSRLGKTKGGKSVLRLGRANHPSYKAFTPSDHAEAAEFHNSAAKQAADRGGKKAAQFHLDRAIEHGAAAQADGKGKPAQARRQPAAKPVAEPAEGSTKLTSLQRDALDTYVGEKFYYNEQGQTMLVNHRNMSAVISGHADLLKERWVEPNRKAALLLKDSIEKQSLPEDQTLYRGAYLDKMPKVGSTMASGRFTSTSSDKNQAYRFIEEKENDEPPPGHRCMIVVQAPKGSQALVVDEHKTPGAMWSEESETIFGPDQAFAVTKVEEPRHYGFATTVYVTAVPGKKRRAAKATKSLAKEGGPAEHRLGATDHGFELFEPGQDKEDVAKFDVTALTAHELAYIKAAYNQQVPTESPVPDAQAVAPEVEALMQSNRLVAGMDVELAAGAPDAEAARRRASRALLERPGFYDGVGATAAVRSLRGLMLDVGCGANRQPGYLGIDLAPMDHGTVRHDVERGLPFPEGSVRAIRLCNSLHGIIDGPGSSGDPLKILTECQRVLMEGGRLYYVGPEPLYEPGQRWPLPGLVMAPPGNKNPTGMDALPDGQVAQELMRVPLRVPAYHGADASYSPAGDLPLELAMILAAYNSSGADRAMADMLNPGLTLPAAPVLRTGGRTTPSLPQQLAQRVNKHMGDRPVPIMKAGHKQIVYGVVLAPDEVDSQDDYMTADDIETAAHAYLATSRVVGSEHGKPIEAAVVESYIAPQNLQFEGQVEPVTKGSWIMGVRIHDAGEWQKALAGGYTGFSVGGFGTRDEV